MPSTSNPSQAKASRSDRHLTLFLAHAFSQPMRLVGQSEASLSSYSVFWCVASHEGRTQVEVARETGLSAKTVSRVISHLGTARNGLGWIKQEADEDDRRVRRLFLSRRGKSLHARMLKDIRKIANALA
ncbi:MAG: winged helix DNA-binding protein [Xanthomonadales bacterium]|nr:winged helix DNA-binding protein [Xanthomonadales bacterium]